MTQTLRERLQQPQALLATGEFERLAQTVYAPLKAWAEQLHIEPLPDAPEDDSSDETGEQA